MVRFLHTADWQIGMTRHFFTAEEQGRYTEARFDAIRRCGEAARQHGCAFIVVGGDVFETNRLGRAVVARALETMGGLGIDVYLLPGNHDPLNAGSVWLGAAFGDRPDNVHLLAEPVAIDVDGLAVELVPAVWRTKHPLTDLVDAELDELGPPAGVRIVVGHGVVDRLDPDPTNVAAISVEAIEARVARDELHYVALGDRHSATVVDAAGRIRYSGTPLVTDYDETRPNLALLVDLDRDRLEVREVEVGDWSFRALHFDLADADDVAEVERTLAAVPDKRRAVVKVSFVGTLSLAGRARLDQVLERFGDLFAALETWERRTDLVVLPDDHDLEDLGLTGAARETAARLQEVAASSSAASAAAQDALSLLARLGRAL